MGAKQVGIIGLGIMGMAFARNLLAAGFDVSGCDPESSAQLLLSEAGGAVFSSPREMAQTADVILISLSTVSALETVVSGPGGLAGDLRPGTVVVEMGTLPIEAKQAAREAVERGGGQMLDCPISGTGAQAAVGDLVVFASGETDAIRSVRPVFDAIARETREVGSFGAGMKLKYVANLLVAIHNVAAAEALLLAERSGLDMAMALDAVAGGAGGSKMLEIRGPLMVDDTYEPATMKVSTFMKDFELITQHAREVGAPVSLFEASLPVYEKAMSEGRGGQDTASVFAVLRGAVAAKE